MPNDFTDIDMIEPTPELDSKKCRIFSFVLRIFLQFTTLAVGLITWYMYDYFIALSALVLSFIITGIIRSKLRNISIPITQREHFYTDKEMPIWYIAKEFC